MSHDAGGHGGHGGGFGHSDGLDFGHGPGIDLGHDFSHGGHSNEFSHGHDPGHDFCHDLMHDSSHGRRGRTVEAMSVDGNTIKIKVAFHGACNIRARFVQVAREMGLLPIDLYLPNLMAEDRTERTILDNDAWNPPKQDLRIMPSGWFPGATGWTRLWREFWQIGVRETSWKFWEPLKPCSSARSYLQVECVTWCYDDIGDLETRLTIRVEALPVWNAIVKSWGCNQKWVARHKEVSEKLARHLFEFIKAHPQPPQCQTLRENRRLKDSLLVPQAPPVPRAAQGLVSTVR